MPPAEDLPPEEPLSLDDASPAPKKPPLDFARVRSEVVHTAKLGAATATRGANVVADRVRIAKLRRRLETQRIELGNALADENWGDPKLLQDVAAAEDPARRREPLLELAAAGETADAVPEAAKRDWIKTRDLAAQLAAIEARFHTAKSELIPKNPADRIRLGVSAAAIGAAMFLGFLLFVYLLWPSSGSSNQSDSGGGNTPTRPPAPKPKLSEPEVAIEGVTQEMRLTASLGLVACGYELDTASGEHIEMPIGHGTGFAVTADGWVFTNQHVVEKTWELHRDPAKLAAKQKEMEAKARTAFTSFKPKVWVFFGTDKYPAEMKHVSGKYDFAILKTDRKGPYFRLRQSPEIPRSQKVFALGFPGAAQVPLSESEELEQKRRSQSGRIEDAFKPRDYIFVLTDGTVSRIAPVNDGTLWVQHNAAINPGNSGGPLVTEDGTVVGINTLLIKDSQGVFFSLGIPQLKSEFERHVSSATWK